MKTIATIILALVLAAPSAWADGDHDRARRALEEGRILPFRDILARAEAANAGRMIEAELEEERGVIVYEIKMLSDDGRVTTLYYDARTGELLRSKGREGHR